MQKDEKMIFYTVETKTEIKLEIELAMLNLSRCIAFVAMQEINDKTEYEFEQLMEEYKELKKLRESSEFAINNDLSINIVKDDYFLFKRWCRFNIESYKRHFLNRKDF